MLYTKRFKNWDFDKEAPLEFDPERAIIAGRQGASEDKTLKKS